MHTSLLPKTNIRLIVLWAAISITAALFTLPTTWLFLILGAILGAVTGFIQLLAMRQASEQLLQTVTMMDVRRALQTSRRGRFYLWGFWLSMVLLFVLAFYVLHSRAIIGLIAGYSAFALIRELLTLKGTFELQLLSRGERK
jgi:prepilin signal peptidase PulO-like enzyme (type II secretory pathway)